MRLNFVEISIKDGIIATAGLQDFNEFLAIGWLLDGRISLHKEPAICSVYPAGS
jgi:hypothetical protein